MTPRRTKNDRILAGGYKHVSGWLPRTRADKIEQEIGFHAEDVQKIAEAPKPRGRKPKETVE